MDTRKNSHHLLIDVSTLCHHVTQPQGMPLSSLPTEYSAPALSNQEALFLLGFPPQMPKAAPPSRHRWEFYLVKYGNSPAQEGQM